MPEIVKQLASLRIRLSQAVGRWQYGWFRWATWSRRLAAHLVMDKHVRLFVPLRCDGEGAVHVSDRTKLDWPRPARRGKGPVLLQARNKDAVVTSSIPPNAIAAGIPARVIKHLAESREKESE